MTKVTGMGLGRSDEWYTPPAVFDALGAEFDLDVAHPGLAVVDWIPAKRIITTNSLAKPWAGFIWMNPPFGGRGDKLPWLEKFLDHGDGVALTPDRTSAPWWRWAAPRADLVLFCKKVGFIPGPGVKASAPVNGVTLMASGKRGIQALRRAERVGFGVTL